MKKISRKQALKNCKKIMKKAEKERQEMAEKEAKQGIQYNEYDGGGIEISEDGKRISFREPSKIPLLSSSKKNVFEAFPPYIFTLEYGQKSDVEIPDELLSNEKIPTVSFIFNKYVKTSLLTKKLQKQIRKEIHKKFPELAPNYLKKLIKKNLKKGKETKASDYMTDQQLEKLAYDVISEKINERLLKGNKK